MLLRLGVWVYRVVSGSHSDVCAYAAEFVTYLVWHVAAVKRHVCIRETVSSGVGLVVD